MLIYEDIQVLLKYCQLFAMNSTFLLCHVPFHVSSFILNRMAVSD